MKYNDSSIEKLEGAERLRRRPESMLGSNGLDGAKHTVIEILGNASDEHLSGFGDKLEIYLFEDGAVGIRDYGRGVPLGYNEKYEQWNYFLIYEELYAGGKYANNQEILKGIKDWSNFRLKDYPYLITVGLNGVGAAATQMTSEYCIVSSFRDGKKSTMRFEKGSHVWDELQIEDTDEENGTFVIWKPDIEVFTDVNITAKWLNELAKYQSYIGGFDVTFNNCGDVVHYEKKTLSDELKIKLNTDYCYSAENFEHSLDSVDDICICDCEIAVGIGGAGYSFFHNKVAVKGGVHSEAVGSALATFLTEEAKRRGIRLKQEDWQGGVFSVIVSTLSNKVSYRGQTKDSLDDEYVYHCIFNTLYDSLRLQQEKGIGWVVDTVEMVMERAENRMALEEMNRKMTSVNRAIKRNQASDKFVSCETYDAGKVSETEFWILEGDSAGSTFKNSRDSRFQCFQKVRGKGLNAYKASLDKILKNKEILDTISILGCGIEDLGTDDFNIFDINKLKVDKIIFGTDADIDGKHIRILLFLQFLRLFPELLYEGKVYFAETPLYMVNLPNGERVFCSSEYELREAQENYGSDIKNIVRFKGLGEAEPEELWETTLNPATRHLVQIKIDRNDMEMLDAVEVLFGQSTDLRKKAVLEELLSDGYESMLGDLNEAVEFLNTLDVEDNLEIEDVEIEY